MYPFATCQHRRVSVDTPPDYTVAVCTLNEETNITTALASLQGEGLREIIVVDGGSSDRTVQLAASDSRVRVIEAGPVGLLRQRLASAAASTTELICFIDADDQLAPGALDIAAREMTHSGLDGVQFTVRSRHTDTWWARGWEVYCRILYQPGTPVHMLGRPCMTRRQHLAPIRAPHDERHAADATFSEDQFIHLQQVEVLGALVYRSSDAVSLRLFPDTAIENLRKWFRYGVGDATTMTSGRRRAKVVYHQLVRCGFQRAALSVRHTYGLHVPWFLLLASCRFAGSASRGFGVRHTRSSATP